jgi:dolichyl-phosphate-mannose-protein mannosyltransferase
LSAEAIVTAGLRPELFNEKELLSASRTLTITVLAVLVLAGFSFRVSALSAEGLSEDELNKLNAVVDYRQHGLTAANGEHPMLMKALQTGSVFLFEKWNNTLLVAQHSDLHVPTETALRLPGVIFGSLITVLIYLLAAELFGGEVALIAAALWAFDPSAIGFNRIAKEDTLLLFFFLLANVFWLRGQRVAESEPTRDPQPYYWATAASYGGMLASKYLPQLLAITISYYWMFQAIPATRWRLGKPRMLLFLLIMGAAFLLLSPTILLPGTWHEMGLFAGQKRIGHDSIEFMGALYSNRLTEWLKGVPWYFYEVFAAVKLPLPTLVGFLVGLPLLFRRKLGDGRYFVLFWLFFWTITFNFTGGKFTRYFTTMLPAVLITTAIGIQFLGRRLASLFAKVSAGERLNVYARALLALLVVLVSIRASALAAPHFRLFTNALGTARNQPGYFFPHDEFYDASIRQVMFEIAKQAKSAARVASETPGLAAYYAVQAKRPDLIPVSLSDPNAVTNMGEGDVVIAARGRRYFSNDALLSKLQQSVSPTFGASLGNVPAVEVYVLDQESLKIVRLR